MLNGNRAVSQVSGDSSNATVGDLGFAVLTVSDRCYAKTAQDVSGPQLIKRIGDGISARKSNVVWSGVSPDCKTNIQDYAKYCCDVLKVDVLITTGGTGLSPCDVTPESIEPLLHRKVDGLATLILQEGLKKTPFASLSRCIAGVRGQTLVFCLPGSCKGALEGLEAIIPIIPHAVDLIQNKKSQVAISHGEVQPLALKSNVNVNSDETTRVRKSAYPMIKMSELPRIFQTNVSALSAECIDSEQAVGRILSESVTSRENIPQRRTSIKDGYAVVFSAPPSVQTVTIIGASFPGQPFVGEIGAGEAVKISTGSPVPDCTQYVVPVENTTPCGGASVRIDIVPDAGCDIREVGSDVRVGQEVAQTGALITEPELGLLAAVGKATVMAVRMPIVALLSTGDELFEPWEPIRMDGVRDSNKLVLKSLLQSRGYQVLDLGIVRDDPDLLLEALTRGFAGADVVITTGGMSMGERDLLKDVLIQDFDATIHFGRLAMKPGKPTGFATAEVKNCRKYWFGLPGNPASAFVTAHLVVLPALRILAGWTSDIFLNGMYAVLGEDLKQDPERVEYMRGVLAYEGSGHILDRPVVTTTGTSVQRSSNVHGCTRANCLIQVPKGSAGLKNGSLIVVYPFK